MLFFSIQCNHIIQTEFIDKNTCMHVWLDSNVKLRVVV